MQTVSDAFNIDELVIRALELDDAEEMAAISNMPGVRHGTLREPFQSVAFTRKLIETMPPNHRRLVGTWNGKIVGYTGLHRSSGREQHMAEIGLSVHDDFAGKGVGGKLLAAVIDLAENWLDIRRLQLMVNVDNLHAIKLYEKHGFKHEGTLRGLTFRNGEYVDGHIMGRLRDDQKK
jgi:putative acetyltransferase